MRIEWKADLQPIQRRKTTASITRRAADRVPRIIKLLVLAHQIEQAIDEGRAPNYTEVARQLGLTRARLTQMLKLSLLSPKIQEAILTQPERIRHLTERQLRPLTDICDWHAQEEQFAMLVVVPSLARQSA